jgi:hypothetical protein
MLERLRHSIEPFRTLIAGALVAFIALAGIAQARAMSEAGVRNGFANHLTLCLQGALDGSLPSSDHDCDACRIPASFALSVLGAAPNALPLPAQSLDLLVRTTGSPISYRATPPSRGPPAAG